MTHLQGQGIEFSNVKRYHNPLNKTDSTELMLKALPINLTENLYPGAVNELLS
jgi:hypothetical protein